MKIASSPESFPLSVLQGGGGGAVMWLMPDTVNITCWGGDVPDYKPGNMPSLALIASVSNATLARWNASVVPCKRWTGNKAIQGGYGDIVASSPFYLQVGAHRGIDITGGSVVLGVILWRKSN